MRDRLNPIIVLLALFLLSAAVRLPNLDRPLSKHHEYATALVLVVWDIWSAEGVGKFNYSPVTNYHNPADLYINNSSVEFMQKDGVHYYLSHPPLAFLLPYSLFKMLGIEHSPLALQCFNIVFHFISAFFIYLITCLLLRRDHTDFCPAGIAAASVYLFTPATLWFFSNGYMSDMFVTNFWIITLYIALRVFLEEKAQSWRWLLSLGVMIFITLYTSWLGFFAAFSIGLYALLTWRKGNARWKVASVSFLAAAGALAATILHYSSILGLGKYMEYNLDRFWHRSLLEMDSNLPPVLPAIEKSLLPILFHYASSFLPVLLLLLALFLFRLKKKGASVPGGLWCFLVLGLLPVFLDHLVFVNYTVRHDFAVLKAAVFISVAVGLLYQGMETEGKHRRGFWMVFTGVILLCVLQYYYINRPGRESWEGHRYDKFQTVGTAIDSRARGDEVVFVRGVKVHPQLLYYSKRNMIPYTGGEEARRSLALLRQNRGILFDVADAEHERRVIRVEYLDLDQPPGPHGLP